MPNTRSAKKRMRQATEARERNRTQRSALRTVVKKTREGAGATTDQTAQALREAEAALDRAARKGLIHKNTAARQKSRLAKARRTQ